MFPVIITNGNFLFAAALSWGGEPSVWTRNWFPKRFSESRPEFAGLEADG